MRTLDQRLDWLAARIAELRLWRDREWRDLDAWTFDGAPQPLGAPWPERRGVHRFAHPRSDVPWPDARLRLDLGGEALVTFTYANEDGGGLVLRAYEPRGARGAVEIGLPGGWAADAQLDLLEREIGPPGAHLGPFAVRSWRLRQP